MQDPSGFDELQTARTTWRSWGTKQDTWTLDRSHEPESRALRRCWRKAPGIFFFFSIFSFICSLSSFLYLFHFILSQIRLRFSTFVSIVAVRFTLRSPREVTYYFHFQFKHLRERNLIGSVWEKYSSLGQSTGDKKAVWCLKNGSQGCRWGWGTRTVRSIPGELGRYL